MKRVITSLMQWIEGIVRLFVRAERFSNEDDHWFARSAFIYTYIGAFVAASYAVFYWVFDSYEASLSLAALSVLLIATTPLHLFGKSRLLAKINLASTSVGLAGVVLHMGGVDSSAACWLLGVTPGVTALLFRRAKEIFQLTSLTLCLYFGIFIAEISGYNVYRFAFAEGSLYERIYTYVHFTAFCLFIATALAIFATTQRKLLREVERQARDVKAILANIHQGIFTINSSELRLGKDYSNFLERIVETKDIQDRNVMDLIFGDTHLNSEQKDMIEANLTCCINESALNFFVNEENFIRELVFLTPDGREKLLLVDWQPIVDLKRDTIEKMLVTLSDVTEIKKMEIQNKRQKREIEIISEILEISIDKFEKFMRSAAKFLEENHRITGEKPDYENLKILFINMHTMKGVARTYHFHHLTATIHECEQYYAQLQRAEIVWHYDEAIEQLHRVQNVFDEYNLISKTKLKRSDNSDQVKIDMESVRENIRLLQKIEGYSFDERLTPFVQNVRNTFYGLYYMETEALFEEICKCLPSLAKDLGKPTPHINLRSINAGIDGDGCEILRNIFIHVLRNSLDHGIELPEIRLSRGKPKEGMIDIDISAGAGDSLYIKFSDDGHGLALEKIHAIAVHRHLIEPNVVNPETIAQLIFHPGLSTAKSVTDISGRGVGMSAAREFIEQIGGRLELRLKNSSERLEASPFEFIFVLPQQYYVIYKYEKIVA